MSVTITRRLATVGASATLAVSGLAFAPADAAQPAERGVSTATATASTDSARGCRVPRCYGAISMSTDAAYGAVYNYGTRRRAVRVAQRRCKAHSNRPRACTRMGWVRNGCQAVAVRWNGSTVTRWETGFGRTKRRAKRNALRKINHRGFVRAWVCTARRY